MIYLPHLLRSGISCPCCDFVLVWGMSDDHRTEMIGLLRALVDCTLPEEDEDAAVERLLLLSPDPAILNYVFHPEPGSDDSPEAAVDRALAYRPVML